MATGEAELSEAQKWCLKARELLGLIKGGRKHGNRMDEALKAIERDLKRVREEIAKPSLEEGKRRDLESRHERFAAEFVEISKLARKAADSGVNEMSQIASERLVILQFEIRKSFFASTPEVEQGLLQAKQLMAEHAIKYKARYETLLATADKQRKELLALNRPKQADAYQQPVVDAIGRAKGLAATESYSEAIGELVAAEEAYKTQLQRAQKERSASMAAARDRPVYEMQHKAVLARLDRIAALPGTADAHGPLVLAVQQIALAAGVGTPFRKAFEQLLALESRLAAAEQASQQFTKNADQTLGGLVSTAQQALSTFASLVGLAQPDVVKQHTQSIEAAVKKLDAPRPAVDVARQELQGVISTIGTATQQAGTARGDYDRELNAVSELLRQLETRATLDLYQPQLAASRKASTEYAAQQYAQALRTLLQLKTDAERILGTVNPAYEEWQRLLADVTQNFLPQLQRAAELSLAELKGATTLLARFIGARDYLAGNLHDYAAAKPVAEEVRTRVGADDGSGWRKVLKDHADLQGRRDEAGQAIQRVQQRLQELEKAGGDVAAFGERLARLGITWHAECDKTVEAGAIAKALDTLKQGLDTLYGEIDGTLTDGGKLTASKASAETAKAAAEFGIHKATAERHLRWLAQEYAGETGPYTLRLNQAVSDLAGKPADALRDVRQLALDLQALIEQKNRAVEQVRKQAQQAGNRFLKAAVGLKDKAGGLAKAYDPLLHEIQALLGLADSSVLVVVQDAKNQLDAYQAIFDRRTQALARIAEKLQALKSKLDDKELKARAPGRHALLVARLKQEIPGRCADDPDNALNIVLTEFEGQIDVAIVAAQGAALLLQGITRLADALDREADRLADMPTLKDDFKARIKAARTPAEGAELSAEIELKQLQQMIEAVLADPELGAGLEQGARQRGFEAEQARNDWEAQLELFERGEHKSASDQHSRIAEWLHLSTRNEQLYKEMETAYADAKNIAKAQDFVRALDRLAAARRLAQQFAANPDSARISAAKQLGRVVENWRAAAAGFVREMNTLIDSVRSKCEQDPAYRDNAEGIVAPLRQLALAFDAGAFDAALGKLDKARDLPTRRAAKEEGLRPLRRVRQLLESDPLLPMLADSPFAKVSTKTLKDAARDLEANLLRA